MKILFISHYTELYGANRSLLALLTFLKNQPDVSLSVLLPREGPMYDRLKKMVIPTHIVPFQYSHVQKQSGIIRKIRSLVAIFADIRRIKRYFSTQHFDLVYSNSSVIAQGLFLATHQSTKHVWHIREFGEADYQLTPVWGMRFQRKLYRKSDALVFVSESLKKQHFNWLLESEKTAVIYNGVFHKDAPYAIVPKEFPGKEIRICFAGFMSPKKYPLEALTLIALLNENGIPAELVVCAYMKGAYAQQIKKAVTDRRLENRVTFKGFVDNLPEVLDTCHFLIMPSRYEAMGRVTAEAMSRGVPVIGYESAGTSELYEDGKSGIYYREISEVLQRIQKITPSEYQNMCIEARKKALADFTIEKYGASILRLCEEIVDSTQQQ